jgi:hypothetical protein
MAGRDFPIRLDLVKLGLPERTIQVLEKAALIVSTIERVTGTETSLDTVNGQIDTLNDAVEDANLSLTSLDTRLDAIETLQPFVRQDQTSAWSAATGTEARTAYAAYGGQTVSNPPTQAEVQAIDDAVKTLGQHLAALINDLRSNGTIHE